MIAKYICGTVVSFFLLASCKKLIEIPDPKNQLTLDKVFENDQAAIAVISNIYGQFNSGVALNGNLTPYLSLYVDELNTTSLTGLNVEFYSGSLTTDNSTNLNIWKGFYSVIYQANALLEGLDKPNHVPATTADQLKGEAKFLRAFSYFYLVNLYGGVPLITTTDVTFSSIAKRSPVDEIYQQIISDLEQAKSVLPERYPGAENARANRWAAAALMARVHLYRGEWIKAENETTAVLSSNLYTPLEPTGNVFKKTSKEVILQIWTPNGFTAQGSVLATSSGTPSYFLTPSFMSQLDVADARKTSWTSLLTAGGAGYNLSVKYKKNNTATGSDAEYLVLLRSAEQFLIRAEAKAEQNNTNGAVNDLNIVRSRSGLNIIAANVSKDSCLSLIRTERKKEFFTEWGHRFFDLKRWQLLDSVMRAVKPTWSSKSSLLPIPQIEISRNPNLTQNFGY